MGFGEVLREFGVKVSLNFDAKKFEEAQSKVDKFSGKLKGFAFEVAGLTAGVFEFQNLFTSNARSLQNQADMLGLNTKELQEYEYAAKVAADVNRDDLVGSLKDLGDTLDKARAGDLAARQSLEQIGGASGNTGLILGRLYDKTYKVTDAFRDLSVGISKMASANPQAAARLTEQTVGNVKLLNLLRQGPKAIDALTAEGGKNFALNERMIRQGYEMDVQMSKLWMTFRKFGYEIGFSVMKHLAPMIQQFEKWFQANKKVIATGINAFIDALANGLKLVFEDSVMLAKALGPVVDMLGGAKNAMNLLIAGFLVFKALGIAISFGEMAVSIYKFIGPMLQLGTVFSRLGSMMKVFGMMEGLADVLPALTLFGEGALAALAPLLPVILAISAAAVGIHDLMTMLSGGSFKDTWTGKGWEKVKDGVGWVGNKLSGANFAGAAPYGQIQPAGAGAMAAAGGSPAVTQENHFSTENNITVPHGTSPAAASHIIAKANVDAHEQMMIKAKLDAGRNRTY